MWKLCHRARNVHVLAVLSPNPSSSDSRPVGWTSTRSLCTKATPGDKGQNVPEVNLSFPRLFPDFMHDFFPTYKINK